MNIVILTGAGISAESGLLTFRDNNGLWCGHRIEDVATPQAFTRNPALVHEFYNMRRAQLKDVQPNAAHHALAELQQRHSAKVTIVTQNVDDLHDRASSKNDRSILLHMHGELKKARCIVSDEVFEWHDALSEETICPCCKKVARMRPHIVWFGEMPLYMQWIERAISECDLFISIGTSGNVYPAAGFVQQARMHGAHTVELNMEPSAGHSLFEEKIYGPATQIVPEYVQRLLKN